MYPVTFSCCTVIYLFEHSNVFQFQVRLRIQQSGPKESTPSVSSKVLHFRMYQKKYPVLTRSKNLVKSNKTMQNFAHVVIACSNSENIRLFLFSKCGDVDYGQTSPQTPEVLRSWMLYSFYEQYTN